MSRTERLLALMQLLRSRRHPVAGSQLADELGISLRSLYRDIATLRSQGADIAGEPGTGYQLRPGYTLPPLMFSAEEIEALVLGSRWVSRHADAALADAAHQAMAKISSVLPVEARHLLHHNTLMVGGHADHRDPALHQHAASLRTAIREQRKARLHYRDAEGACTRRTVWPFAIGFFGEVQILAAWCEYRGDFRHFRLDRIEVLEIQAARCPHSAMALLHQWSSQLGMRLPQGL